MSKLVELLSQPTNFAVVQLPGRNYPGVVVQGDTLHTLVQRVEGMIQSLNSNDFDELAAGLEEMREQLSSARTHYESVCVERGIALPYLK